MAALLNPSDEEMQGMNPRKSLKGGARKKTQRKKKKTCKNRKTRRN
jgi:hypothetical protein